MRGQLSALLGAGHVHAEEYPIGMVWDETRLVRERLNGQEATRALFTQMAVAGVISEKANKHFRAELKKLED